MEVGGNQLRTILDLRSACFTIAFEGDTVTFSVTGYGHGVGMSQYGANVLAISWPNIRLRKKIFSGNGNRRSPLRICYAGGDFSPASVSVTGYGHGVGMSQYGANVLAQGGMDYREILSWYYTGASVEPFSSLSGVSTLWR